jgi:hypothetical protein
MATAAMSAVRRQWLLLPLAVLFAWIVRDAWVCDDAYITLRTADNLLHGYGLTWNPGERVQAFTHPLWMFLLAGAYGASGDAFHAAMGLGLVVSFSAVILLGLAVLRSAPEAMIAIAALMLSRAFVDYSTSGLENPATHLAIALFLVVCFRARKVTYSTLLRLSLISACGALVRLDYLLLIGPAWIAIARVLPGRRHALRPSDRFLLIAWEIFSCSTGRCFRTPPPAQRGIGRDLARRASAIVDAPRLDPDPADHSRRRRGHLRARKPLDGPWLSVFALSGYVEDRRRFHGRPLPHRAVLPGYRIAGAGLPRRVRRRWRSLPSSVGFPGWPAAAARPPALDRSTDLR